MSFPNSDETMDESRSGLALTAALRLMAPLVELLLQEGVTYPRFTSALKATFLEAAEKILEANATRANDSSLSVLSGVHRKDVRAWHSDGKPLPQAKTLSVAMEIYTRWASDKDYCESSGSPRVLERTGGPGSFEALATAVSSDVHPHTVLKELIRLGIVRRMEATPDGNGDKLALCADAFVPKDGSAEMLQLFSANVGDHIAAAVHNIKGNGDPMLEQGLFADGLRPQSADVLGAMTRKIWARAFSDVAREATRLSQQDQGQPDANRRVRFGMYYFQGPIDKA